MTTLIHYVCVCVPTPDAKKVCSEELWPCGVVVRPWVFRPTGSRD